ncbi:MAG: MgtC/SapB family protein [Microbacteriaceae bacterium]
MFETIDILSRIAASVLLGSLIGIERQWRSRSAGLRTNALVSLGSALFVVMGAYSFTGTEADPTRVAAQVASGIGFLGAGVIMKQGASVRGLNTAATLWASAAVGALAGGGMLWIAAAGTAMIMLANTLLRPLSSALDRNLAAAEAQSSGPFYDVEVRCEQRHEPQVRSLVLTALSNEDLQIHEVSTSLATPEVFSLTARVQAEPGMEHHIEHALYGALRSPEVTAMRWAAV